MNNQEQKKKRFYKKGQIIWAVELKKEVEVKSVNKDDLTITVLENTDEGIVEHRFPLWSVDVLKYKAKEELVKTKKSSKATNNDIRTELEELKKLVHSMMYPDVYFSKLKEDVIIPTKRKEDAGYDVYANLEDSLGGGRNLLCPKLKTTLVPTGLAIALPATHYFNCKHERGSTGKISMSVLAGVVDSGYRNEIFIAITPLHKDVAITDLVDSVQEYENIIYYPYSKAIAQATIDLVVAPNIKEKEYADLLKMESERGLSNLGASGK